MRASPFITIDKQTVIGALKATGSTDPDILHAARTKLVRAVAVPRWFGVGVGLGALPTALSGAGVGWAALLLVAGSWLVHRGHRNVRMVETGYAELLAAVQRRRQL